MKTIQLSNDIHLVCIQAASFPEGIKAAFDQLYTKVPNANKRLCYGIYEENEKGIVYRAALEQQGTNEAKDLGMESFVITKGNYGSVMIKDWATNIPSIGATFCKMLEDPEIDQNSPSIEAYQPNGELCCMLKFKD